MLEIALIVLAVVCVLLCGYCLWLARNQRQLTRLQAERDALHDKKLRELTKALDIYLAGSVRIGGEDITGLQGAALRQLRQRIGRFLRSCSPAFSPRTCDSAFWIPTIK